MRCHECDHGFQCCHGLSVRYADGSSECLGDEPCDLAHDLHAWRIDEDVVEPAELLPLAA